MTNAPAPPFDATLTRACLSGALLHSAMICIPPKSNSVAGLPPGATAWEMPGNALEHVTVPSAATLWMGCAAAHEPVTRFWRSFAVQATAPLAPTLCTALVPVQAPVMPLEHPTPPALLTLWTAAVPVQVPVTRFCSAPVQPTLPPLVTLCRA